MRMGSCRFDATLRQFEVVRGVSVGALLRTRLHLSS